MRNNLKKEKIIKELSINTGLSVNYSKKLINDLIVCMTNQISKSNLNLKNFGIFKVSYKNQRIGRNPKTKKEYVISSRKSLRFVPSENLKEYLNQN